MPTTRTKRTRAQVQQISPKVVELFRKLKATPYVGQGDAWWEAHWLLHQELGCKPWHWPCVEEPDIQRNYEPRPEALALWQELDRAARAR